MVKKSRSSDSAQKQKKKGKMIQAGPGTRSAKVEGPKIDPRIQREIGKHLRAHYDDLISEPVPDRFIELLQQLERSVGRKS